MLSVNRGTNPSMLPSDCQIRTAGLNSDLKTKYFGCHSRREQLPREHFVLEPIFARANSRFQPVAIVVQAVVKLILFREVCAPSCATGAMELLSPFLRSIPSCRSGWKGAPSIKNT